MPFTLDQIVPWGRSFDEYVAMFALTADDLEKRIVGCGDGPASFNATMHRRGMAVVSVDPLYQFSKTQIERRIREVYATIVEQLSANQDAYLWTSITSPQHLGETRMLAMGEFLQDYERGKVDRRYVAQELPRLPFDDGAFDLALCSHLLFTYSAQLPADFHAHAVLEMCRVAEEVRIFPIVDMSGGPSCHMGTVCDAVSRCGYRWAVERVHYEFQRGGNQMLRVQRGGD